MITMKRKGNNYELSEYNSDLNASTIASEESVYELLNNVRELYERDAEETEQQVQQIKDQLDGLRYRAVDETKEQAGGVKSKVQSFISEDVRLYQEQVEEMNLVEEELKALRQEIAEGSKSSSELEREIQEIENRMKSYIAEYSEQVEKIDEVEHARMSQLPRLKNCVRVHAMITKIKWDLEHGSDMLRGEISVPLTNEVVRFSLDPSEYSECEVANYFANIIGGGNPSLEDAAAY